MALAIIAEGNDACKIAYCRVCLDVFKQNTGSGRRRKVCSSCSPSWKPAKTCQTCGVLLPPGSQRHKFCSTQCRTQSTKPIKKRVCEACGTSLELYRKRWCQCCAAAKKRKASASRVRGRMAIKCTCRQCGTLFHPLETKKNKYCSHACAYEGLRQDRGIERLRRQAARPGPYKRIYLRNCKMCSKAFYGRTKKTPFCSHDCKKKNARQQSFEYNARLKVVKPVNCKECGVVFVAQYGDGRRTYCSHKCSAKAARRINKPKRRALLRAVSVESVDPLKVFDRDGWRCQICHRPTPKRLRGSIDERAPELDHIVPLARGGEHSYRNTQCACRKCNASKGAKPYGQLLLIAV